MVSAVGATNDNSFVGSIANEVNTATTATEEDVIENAVAADDTVAAIASSNVTTDAYDATVIAINIVVSVAKEMSIAAPSHVVITIAPSFANSPLTTHAKAF